MGTDLLAIYLVPFLVVGWIAKRLLDRWMNGATLRDIHDLAGPNRGARSVFLLGSWRTER